MQFTNHRCQVNQNQSVWSQHRKHRWTLPKYGFARKLLKDSIFLFRPGVSTAQKINDMSYNQLMSDSSAYVKKRAQRSEDSIFLRHMDDVVGTGPEEHLISDFQYMKTSLYLTDMVVLRHEDDTVNFLGLEITNASKGFELKTVQTSWNPFFESLLEGKLGTGSRSWQTFDSVGARVSNSSWMVMNSPTFAQPSENSSSWHFGDQTCNVPSNNYPHEFSTPRQGASAQ